MNVLCSINITVLPWDRLSIFTRRCCDWSIALMSRWKHRADQREAFQTVLHCGNAAIQKVVFSTFPRSPVSHPLTETFVEKMSILLRERFSAVSQHLVLKVE